MLEIRNNKQQSTLEGLTFGSSGFVCFGDGLSDTPLRNGGFVVVSEGWNGTVREVALADLVDVGRGGVLRVDLLVFDELTELGSVCF